MMTACVSFQGLKAHLYCVVGDDDDRMCVISGPQSSYLLCRGWWWWPHVCHFRASKLIFIVSWVMMMTACVSFQGLKAHIYCVVGDDDDRMCVISGPQSSSLLCRGWWWWPHVCHFRASKLIFIVSWVMMMTACVSFQGIKAHLYCVVGDDADCLCVISGPQSSSLLCRVWWCWLPVCHFRASKLIFIVSWVMMLTACVSFPVSGIFQKVFCEPLLDNNLAVVKKVSSNLVQSLNGAVTCTNLFCITRPVIYKYECMGIASVWFGRSDSCQKILKFDCYISEFVDRLISTMFFSMNGMLVRQATAITYNVPSSKCYLRNIGINVITVNALIFQVFSYNIRQHNLNI